MSELEDLRRDVIELREWKAAIISKCRASDGFDALEWGGDKEGWGFIHYFIGHLETRALGAEKHLHDLPQAVPVTKSSGCVFCDIGSQLHHDELLGFHHIANGEPVLYSLPRPEGK